MTNFEGHEEKIKRYIYDATYDATNYKKADLYIQTTNEVVDHVSWIYKKGADTRKAILKMEITVCCSTHSPS
jgi:hypothetical protein